MNQADQFSARGPVHAMVQLSGFTLYGGKKLSNEVVCHMKDRPGLGSHRPQGLCVWQRVINSQVMSYAIKLICFINPLMLFFC